MTIRIPPSFRFSGDVQKAISLKPRATVFYNQVIQQAELGGIPFTKRTLELPDGSLIVVTSYVEGIYDQRYGRIEIVAGSKTVPIDEAIYLESGYLNLRSASLCTVDTFKPAILTYNPPLLTYILGPEIPPQGWFSTRLTGQRLPDNFQSLSVGSRKLSYSTTDSCGNSYSSSSLEFAIDKEEILMQKMAQNRVPSSFYSGKMRLFIQSLYGSRRTDYKINTQITGLPVVGDYNLYLETLQGTYMQLEWGYPYTCGIFTSSKYEYFLLKVTSSFIQVYPLITTGTFIKKYLLTLDPAVDAELITKLEAYVLSTAMIDTTKLYQIPVTNPVGMAGGVLGYGWKFSKSGKECRVVLHTDISSLGDASLFTATEVKIAISEDEETGKLSAISTTTASGNWHHAICFSVWTPEFFAYSQYQYGKNNATTTVSFANTPIYGWYEGEEYKSINATASILQRNDLTTAVARQVTIGCEATDLSSQHVGQYNGINGVIAVSGLYTSSATWEGMSSSSTYEYHWGLDLAVNDEPVDTVSSSNVGIYMCDVGMTGEQYLISQGFWEDLGAYSFIKWVDSGAYYIGKSLTYYTKSLLYNQINRGATSDTGRISIIVPLKDCEAISVCTKQVRQQAGSNSAIDARDSGNTGTYSIAEDCVLKWEKSSGIITIDSRGAQHPLINNPIFNTASSGTIVPNPASITETGTFEIVERTSKAFSFEEDGYVIRSTSGGSGSSSWIDPYVSGTFGMPLGNPVITQTSYNGGTVTYHNQVVPENRNGYKNHSAVGWA